mmetsp:Transcript_24187/g.36058  ORF Transcript_24187/g.36058 Transcript_24187/m.36058 type:complete len:611 (+) Transcript_24187:273-2105(+)
MDVKPDGSGIESTGWFRSNEMMENEQEDGKREDDSTMISRLCALQWIVVLYESVVPDSLKAEYAREFISPIIHQLVDNPPGLIIFKSFEVLATITAMAKGEHPQTMSLSTDAPGILSPSNGKDAESSHHHPLNGASIMQSLDELDPTFTKSRDREVFASLIHLFSHHHRLLSDLSKVIKIMCTFQPPEFVFASFALELDNFIAGRLNKRDKALMSNHLNGKQIKREQKSLARDIEFVSSFVQQMNHVLLTASETAELRATLNDSIGPCSQGRLDPRRVGLFQIILYAFSHNLVAALSLCLWGGAYLTAYSFLQQIDPLDVDIVFYLELDQLIELIERPLFRHLHLRMLECDSDPSNEGSSLMLFRALKSMLMLIPQSTSYNVLKARLQTVSRFRQSAIQINEEIQKDITGTSTAAFVARIHLVRKLHCDAKWQTIRAESLEHVEVDQNEHFDEVAGRRSWLGYADEEEENLTKGKMKKEKARIKAGLGQSTVGTNPGNYDEFHNLSSSMNELTIDASQDECKACLGSGEEVMFRHPDEVLPKDQINNFQALTRHGMIHQQMERQDSSAGLEPSNLGIGNLAHSSLEESGDADSETKAKWMEYWAESGAQT